MGIWVTGKHQPILMPKILFNIFNNNLSTSLKAIIEEGYLLEL